MCQVILIFRLVFSVFWLLDTVTHNTQVCYLTCRLIIQENNNNKTAVNGSAAIV